MKIPLALTLAATLLEVAPAQADGLIRPPVTYEGSLEERAQEAIIVFREGTEDRSAVEDLILKIRVEGEARHFAWIVPLPNAPQTSKADPKLFAELHRYVQTRQWHRAPKAAKSDGKGFALGNAATDEAVKLISREVVGAFDVAVVRETQPGVLNQWLTREGFQPIEGGEKIIEDYRKRNYVFACVKVSDVTLAKGAQTADLHPLRFRFETGGRDGIYFPMRITGLQSKPFDINLYVFYRAWLNDNLNRHGYQRQGFTLHHRDWDTNQCQPNAGKDWSNPARDPYLKGLADTIPTVSSFLREHHREARFYLTNLKARDLNPRQVRRAKSDLWLFPYYTNRSFVPFDKRKGGVAR